MSTIFGAWHLDKKPIAIENIERVIQKTAWWKPDKQDLYHQKEFFLAHQLLATQAQQQRENQPYYDAHHQLYIIADARLDNRKELQRRLGLNAKVDYKLILKAYVRYGIDCLQYFIGAFAFAIWDKQKQQLFCARDQMGVKPFNYYFYNRLFAFGTQKKSILALPEVNRQPNWRNILNKISDFPLPPNSTHYQYIQRLPPAHYVLVNTAGIQVKPYWELDIHQSIIYQKDTDYIDHFRALFHQAIQDRMICNNRVGAHLSGGLDSSGITSIAHKISQENSQSFHAFSYSVPKDYSSENMDRVEENLLVYDLVDYCQLKNFHNIYTPIQENFKTKVEEEAQACDELAQSNNVNTEYELQAAAQAKGVDVLLSGFPGDELVTSFCRAYYLEYLERGALGAYFFKHQKSRHQLKDKIRALFGTKSMQLMPKSSLWVRQKAINWRDRKKHYAGEGWVINKDYFNSNRGLDGFLQKQFLPSGLYPATLKAYQRDHVCRPHTSRRIESETLAGLRFKVEYRYPMTDIRLLQYVVSLPLEQKITPTITRYLYRRAMEGYLPDSIRLREMKYKGSLKTTHLIHPINHQDASKLEIWDSIKNAHAAPFMNQDLVEKFLNSKRSPYGLYRWMILGQLGVTGEFSF